MNPTIIIGNLLWPEGFIRPGRLTFSGKQIMALEEESPALQKVDAEVITVPEGGVAAPGFIDLQIYGAYGYDFTTNPESIPIVARMLPRVGVTSFLPTIGAAPLGLYANAITAIKSLVRSTRNLNDSYVLGLHFEGPYHNPLFVAAHAVEMLRQPNLVDLDQFDPTIVKLITLAPELPGAIEFIQEAVRRGIRIGLGHSDASYAQAIRAIEAGAEWSTHLFHAMRPLQHRGPGIVGALLEEDRMIVSLVVDGAHIHPSLLHVAVSSKSPHGVSLISNAVAPAGLPMGRYTLGSQQRVTVDENAVRFLDGTLAGSATLLDQAVRNMVSMVNRPLHEVLLMASSTPARAIGAERKGRLTPGYDADIVILDSNKRVVKTLINGKVVFQAE